MKVGLKTRLIISYTALSLLLVLSLSFIANSLLEKQFNNYVQEKREQKNLELAQLISAEFASGNRPSHEFLVSLGEEALRAGTVLSVMDKQDNQIFCMKCFVDMSCENTLNSMENAKCAHYPNSDGHYTEKIYPLNSGEMQFGHLKLGFYGPYYYNEADRNFVVLLNAMFMETAIIFLIIAFGLGFFMADRISRPIKAVTLKTMEIKDGNYTDRINFASNTSEISCLIESVNALASTLEAQQKLKKRMAMDYAHEFRTPLAAIQSNLEGIIDGIFAPTNERIESIRQEILRLSRMVSEIDKITEFNILLNKEQFNFYGLITQNITTFEADLQERNVSLNLYAVPCEIYADKDKISGVVLNLISNAVKFTETNGTIDILLQDKKDSIVFSVSDNGIGIDESDIPYIFDHLYRADLSRTRNTGGSGIGLSVVNAALTAHGGTISVKSEIGVGSVFTVTLPKE